MRIVNSCLIACLVTFSSFAQVNGKVFNILDFGAKGDGTTNNTQAFQQAIDALVDVGGGRLIVPEGTFLTGSIWLKSHVDLYLEKGAVLLGSLNPDDYRKARHPALILAHQQKNISISGQGVINGRGRLLAIRIDSIRYTQSSEPSITGIPGHPVENVTLENIEIVFPGRGNTAMAYIPLWRLNRVPEQETHYPEFSMFGELPAWGMYVRHVKGLIMKNITVRAEQPDYRPAFVFDDVSGLKMDQIRVFEDDDDSQIILENVTDETLNVDMQMVKTVRP